MTSFIQGGALPDITQTTTKTTEAPSFYTDYLSGLSQAGQSGIYQPGTFDPKTGTGTLKTGTELIAGYDPLQNTGYGQFETAAGAYKPGLATATQNLASGAGVDQADINRFMNPYTTNVVNEMERLAQQNIQRNLLPSLTAGAVGRGDLGSRRYAGALGQSLADVQKTLTGQQYGALSKGYESALDAALKEAGLQQTAAERGANIAKMEQTLGLGGAEALTKAGAERQAYEQAKIDAPLKQAANAAALMRGYQVPLDTTEKFVGPKAGLYQKSPFETISGLAALIGAASTGTAMDRIGKLFGGLSGTSNGLDLGGGMTYSFDKDGNIILPNTGTSLGPSPTADELDEITNPGEKE